MSKKTADQHEVVNRWREIADELAGALSEVRLHLPVETSPWHQARAALRRYEEARDR